MKTINETIEKIKKEFRFEMAQRDINRQFQWENEEMHHWQRAKQFEKYADENQEKMNKLVDMYSFITEINWMDARQEIEKGAE